VYAFSPARLASLVPVLIAIALLLAVVSVGARTGLAGARPIIPAIQHNVPLVDDQPLSSPQAPARDASPVTTEPAADSGTATTSSPPPVPTMLSGSNAAAPRTMGTPSRWSEPVEDGAPALTPPQQTNPKGPPPGGMGQ
jgi:hypothetical protein